MKLPNGYGSISKLSGKRRNPYIVRVTTGFDENGRQIFKTLGYVKTRKEGLELLAKYHADPNAVTSDTTFEQVYEMLFKKREGQITDSTKRTYVAAFKAAAPLHKMKIIDIKLQHLQNLMDNMKNSPGSKKGYKAVYNQMFELAMQNDIISKNYVQYLETGKAEKSKKETFSATEVKNLWKHQGDFVVDCALVMLYTGMRIGELLDIKIEDVHLEEQYMIGGSKTEAGKDRMVPIADKIMPIVERLYGDGSNKYLVANPNNRSKYPYTTFAGNWKNKLAELEMEHTMHETRHTFVSNLYKENVEPAIVRKIVGHSGKGVTEQVYLHVELPQLLDAVNKLK